MGFGRIMATSHDIWPNHPCCVLVVDEAFLTRRPDAVAAVVRTHVKANRFIRNHPEKARSIGVKYTGMPPETVRIAMSGVHYTWEINVDGEKEYVRFLSNLQYIKRTDPERFVQRLIDSSILDQVKSEAPM
jgi:NitT/TauT family transport system substrate-binding protein